MLQDSNTVLNPVDYTFEVNGVQIVCIDSVTNGTDHRGGLSAEQLSWLERICTAPDDRPMIIAIHHHLLPLGSEYIYRLGMMNGQEVHNILLQARHRLRGVFGGHIHETIDIYQDGILYSFAPSNHTQHNIWPGVAWSNERARNHTPSFSVVTLSDHRTYVRRYPYRVQTL